MGGGIDSPLRIYVKSYAEAADPLHTPISVVAVVETDGQAGVPIQVVVDRKCLPKANRGSICTTTVTGENFFLEGSMDTSRPARIFNATYRSDTISAGMVCTF
jgi:hypothetical protein